MYRGKDNDDYQGWLIDDDNIELHQFYYHPDHLGSSSYITNLDGEIAQHIENAPFGEVFLEEKNNVWNTPYKFNSKTGELLLVKRTNDKFDRILRTDNKGNIKLKGTGFFKFLVKKSNRGKPKVAIGKISKGLLKDKMNIRDNSTSCNVNGKNQPTLKEFNYFISEFSDYVGKEISGVRMTNGKNNTSRVLTNAYKTNTYDCSFTPRAWLEDKRVHEHFHTHPTHHHKPSSMDLDVKFKFPKNKYFIISGGYEKEY